MTSSIGIKIANGEFYPVLSGNAAGKKRLILTTVHDDQRSVQIDLYRSEIGAMSDAMYIGSLVVENISPKTKGEPSIELVISSDGTEELSAEALDMDADSSGERQRLNVLLQGSDQGNAYEIPDFELDSEPVSTPPAGLFDEPEPVQEDQEAKPFPLVPVLIAAIVLLALAALLLFWPSIGKPKKAETTTVQSTADATGSEVAGAQVSTSPGPEKAPEAAKAAPAAVPATESVVAVKTESVPKVVEPAAKPVPEPAPVVPPAAASVSSKRTRPAAPVKSYKVPRTLPKEGFKYRIGWGDTLWDISEAFYRNPWLYPRIASFNKIRNPDLIISGAFVRIPPKN